MYLLIDKNDCIITPVHCISHVALDRSCQSSIIQHYPQKYKKLTVSLALISIPMSDILLSRKFHVSSKSGDLSLTMYNSEI